MPILLPTGSAIALLIYCVSPGPVLYLQERVGFRGRRFICLKFRTMKPAADTGSHRQHSLALMRSNRPMNKLDGEDPRLIPLGALLRASGLDEIPQVLNVLAGQMSLVGPRPCLPYEYENYRPEEKQRLEAVPGLTGLWQVNGKNRTTFQEMIDLDIRYARTQSPWLDMKIMFLTLPVVVGQLREARSRRQRIPTGGLRACRKCGLPGRIMDGGPCHHPWFEAWRTLRQAQGAAPRRIQDGEAG
jgi:lipopolysaccharide/colanic/teichoic acid biosynthesis glycosyltransferase